MQLTLDHVGLVARAIAPLRRAFIALGFAPTEHRLLQGVDPLTGQLRSLQQESCHVVFGSNYLELSAVLTDSPQHHLAPWLTRGPGMHILALGTEDLPAVHAACLAAGLKVSEPRAARRDIAYGTRHGQAAFDWFMLDASATPEALICVVHNRTPQLVYQPEVTLHPNKATGIEAVYLAASDPASWIRRHAPWCGGRPHAEQGVVRLRLAQGEIAVGSLAQAEANWGMSLSARDGVGGDLVALSIRVPDLALAQKILAENGVPAFLRPTTQPELVIAPRFAGGVLLALK